MAIYTYLRTSTKKQSTERQEYIFEQQGIKANKEFKDKLTGTRADRPALNELKATVKDGDIVYFVSISRMARNLKDCIEICDYFVEKNVQVKILKEGIDTSTSTYKLLLGIFGAVAEMDTIAQQYKRGLISVNQLEQLRQVTGLDNLRKQKKLYLRILKRHICN